jgi:exodeoxyribonuclease VII small subunit
VKQSKPEASIKFEHALAELEKTVQEMESADLPLEKLIERYESGMRLVRICGEKLSEAEQKVEVLARSRSDEAGAAAISSATVVTGRGRQVASGTSGSARRDPEKAAATSEIPATPTESKNAINDDDVEKEDEVSLF